MKKVATEPKTNAQYQAAYRQRVRDGAGRRISTVVSVEVYDALTELSVQQARPCRAILEELILEASRINATKALAEHEKAEQHESPQTWYEKQQEVQRERERENNQAVRDHMHRTSEPRSRYMRPIADAAEVTPGHGDQSLSHTTMPGIAT